MTPVAVLDEPRRAEQQMELPMAVLLRRRAGERTMQEGRQAMPDGRQAMPTGRQAYGRVRSDSLPEHTRYRDDGCEVSPSCLTCPLPRCRYDEPGGLRGLVNSYRDGQMLELRLKGAPVEALAERFGVSRRTVFRILGTSGNQRREAHCA